VNIFLENVDVGSTSGPNYFAQKLVKYLELRGTTFNQHLAYDLKLTFIQSAGTRPDLPMIQRLDGIYFNANFDCGRMNHNIKRTYEKSAGVIFQTEFNKNLIFKWFGPHDHWRIINNGADILYLDTFIWSPDIINQFDAFENIWSCAAHWHPFKRLQDNVEYFLTYGGEKDCLVVAGPTPDYIINHPRVFYMGNLNTEELLTLFKISKYFIHLAYLDHCPNVVIDARACGCKIICSSTGGTKEIAGISATVIEEPEWDFSFLDIKKPPQLNYDKVCQEGIESIISMAHTARNYSNFFTEVETNGSQ
jgi:glycosyltransferase involved in cell wall biosynthesis